MDPRIQLLNDSNPMARNIELSNTSIQLFPHQLTMIHRMRELEQSSVNVSVPQVAEQLSLLQPNGYAFEIRSRIGVLADKVGAGKSYEILSMVLQDAEYPIDNNHSLDHISRSFCNDRLILTSKAVTSMILPMSIIVVPHSLIKQWTQYITHAIGTKLNVGIVSRGKHLPINVDAFDLLLVSTTYHNELAHYMKNKVVRRVIYDEADSIRIPNCRRINASFHWFSTASYVNLLRRDIRSSGFIRNIFCDLGSSDLSRLLAHVIILKNDEAFVDASLNVPPISNHVVMCRSPMSLNVLHGMVDMHVIECLNAGDVTSAIQQISPSCRQSQSNIITILIEKLTAQLHNLRILKQNLETMHFDTLEDREVEDKRLSEKISALVAKISAIKTRIVENDSCCICFNPIMNKTILPCCSNSYCFSCIMRWASLKPTCPLCKSNLSTSNIFVVSESNVNYDTEDHSGSSSISHATLPDKMESLKQILQERVREDECGRMLLCSGFDNTFCNLIIPLLNELQISFRSLKGNQDTMEGILRDFKSGLVRVLLINPNYYGSGLNCEMATDIILMHKFSQQLEQQVIGRAQRVGRSAPLNVWSLRYDNEL